MNQRGVRSVVTLRSFHLKLMSKEVPAGEKNIYKHAIPIFPILSFIHYFTRHIQTIGSSQEFV